MDIQELKDRLAESERKREELETKFELLNDFVENASIPLHWVNGSGIIIWANEAELNALGYSREEYLGRHISSFHADKEVIDDILARLIRKETIKNYPVRLYHKNGTIKHALIHANALWKDNEFVHTRCFTTELPVD